MLLRRCKIHCKKPTALPMPLPQLLQMQTTVCPQHLTIIIIAATLGVEIKISIVTTTITTRATPSHTLSTITTITQLGVPNLPTSLTRTLTRPMRNGKLPQKAVISQSFEKERVEVNLILRIIIIITTITIHQEEVVEAEAVVVRER